MYCGTSGKSNTSLCPETPINCSESSDGNILKKTRRPTSLVESVELHIDVEPT
jgi:hypothetical protein